MSPGTINSITPETPEDAGIPTLNWNSPLELFIPQELIIERQF
jgi:hypothetical protein